MQKSLKDKLKKIINSYFPFLKLNGKWVQICIFFILRIKEIFGIKFFVKKLNSKYIGFIMIGGEYHAG